MIAQAERALQTEIMWKLARYPVIAIPIPNGTWLPVSRGEGGDRERALVGKIINRMKATGMMVPGSPDLILLGAKGALCVELKRPASKDVSGRHQKGRLSPEQKAFRERCANAGVSYLVAYCWEDVQCSMGGVW